jgi:acetyl-CoA acetyltransferase
MSQKVCIIGGATTPFDYGPTGFESIEGGAAECVKETQRDVPEFSLRDLDLMIYSHFSVHFGHQLAPEWIIHDHLGLVGLPHYRVENGGNTGGSALYAAALAVMSGHHDGYGIAITRE